MRASIILKEKKVPYQEVVAGLDWPIKFTDNGLIPINAKDEYDLPKEPASGCGCQVTQLLKLDSTKLLRNSIVEHLPRVPILIDSDTGAVICDVLSISEYLEEEFTEYTSLLSDDIIKRSDIRVFSSHIHADLLPLMSGMSYANSFRKNDKHSISEETNEQLHETLDLLESTLKRKVKKGWNGKFLFGNFSLADAMFSPMAQQIRGWNIEVESEDVNAYLDAVLSRESVKMYLNEAREPYILLNETVKDSPAWIARHYRFWPEINMIHNCEKDVFHIIENEVGLSLFNLAFKGYTRDDIANTIAKDYNVEKDILLEDIDSFFTNIHPNKNVENNLNVVF
ncbi:glutathione S-transferase family protein [Priestia megaterium]|nr:glutathione S-transferase family protein [Priestia megaterium]